MGFQTQSPFPGQAYSMGCMNSANSSVGGASRQTCQLPSVPDIQLASQKSIYSLTLEEFQNSLGEPGKSFGSMNMEELLKNIWTAEESQAVAAAMGARDVPGPSKQVSLQKQGSLSLNDTLGRKTVDEIWNSVYQGPVNPTELGLSSSKQSELTFKEVTLEDFLVKTGIVAEEDTGRNMGVGGAFRGSVGMNGNVGNGYGAHPHTSASNNSMLSSPTSVLAVDMHQGFPSLSFQRAEFPRNLHQDVGNSHNAQRFLKQFPPDNVQDVFAASSLCQTDNTGLVVSPIGLAGLGSPVGGEIAASLNASTSYGGFNNPLSMSGSACCKAESPLSSDGTGTSQGSIPLSPVYHAGMSAPLRKRLAEGQLEADVERRQRRMIKNRESAVRSRARKQAYTMELENELSELRKENEKLKEKQERAEKQLKKVLAVTNEPPKQQRMLLRSRTGPW